MASLEQLRNEKTKYINLKNKIKDVSNGLSRAISALELASDEMINAFSIDGCSADSNLICKSRQELINKKIYLSGTVINSIDSKISSLNKQIDAELARIAIENLTTN